jgi:PAS domain S-box-containing protein
MNTEAPGTSRDFLSGSGQMENLVRQMDWSKTPLGAMEQWPAHLRTTVSVCLQSKFPMLIWWGKELISLYNDAYAHIIAEKHPRALGAPGKDLWPESSRASLEGIVSGIMKGETSLAENELVLLNRSGYPEECYFTFSRSPIQDASGEICGILTVANETTELIINRRHLSILSELGMAISGKRSIEDIYSGALSLFKKHPEDFPFTMVYQVADDMESATLFGSSGFKSAYPSIPQKIIFQENGKIGSRNFKKCVETNEPITVHDLRTHIGDMPSGAWHIPPEETLLFPVSYPGKKYPYAVLVIGVNPHKRLNEQYTAFFRMLADKLATEISNFLALEEQEYIVSQTRLSNQEIQAHIKNIKEAEEKSAKLAAIVKSSSDAIISKTLEGIITSWNESAERIFGYTSEEIIGQSISLLVPADRLDEEPRILQQLKETGFINHFETQRLTKDKRILDISLTVSLVRDSNGRIIGISKIARDITDKKQAQRFISESEERLRLAAESAELGTWDLDISNGMILSSTIDHKIIEFSDSGPGLKRKDFLKHVHPDDRSLVSEAFSEALKYGKLSFEARLIRRDQTQLWVRIKGKTIFNERQRPVRLLGTIMDITEQKNFLIELEESEKRFRNLANNAPVMIWTSGTDASYDFFNKAWLDFTGHLPENESGDGWLENIAAEDLETYKDTYNRSFENKSRFTHEYKMKRHDGSYRWITCEGIPRYASDGTFVGYIGSCLDIHDSKLAKEELESIIDERTSELHKRNAELQQQKDFVETMLDASIDIMLVYDKDMRFRSFNKACELKYGLKKDEVLGKRLLDIYPYAAGSQGYLDLQRALAGETIHNPVYKSAVTDLYYEDFLIPMKTPDNEVYSVLVIAHDITGNIASAEKLKQTNADLVKSNRDLEQFAYIASHDLQEPLRKIQTFASLLESNINNEAARKKYFDKISSSAQRMSDLIKAVLNYSRLTITREKFELVNIATVIEQVKIDFELLIAEKRVSITYDELPEIKGIFLQLIQLFSNLISNSIKFSDKDPVIHISSRLFQGGDISHYPHLDPSQTYYEFVVKDNGIGFDQQYVEQMFTIFQRLHDRELYEGTGIGLALCKKIVDNHHGYLNAKSEPGKGSSFFIYLPVQA